MKNYFKSGAWNVLCDRCGQKLKSTELRREWTGYMVCGPCFETRHPQDFLRVHEEKISVPWSRPIEDDTTSIFVCYLIQSQGVADLGTADCARADINLGLVEDPFFQ
jgi:hypothetical protein